jgi:hypothetical protein
MAIGVLILSIPLQATAAPRPPNEQGRKLMAWMALVDRDGKGYVTEDDFLRGRPFAGRLFSVLDRNRDGVLDRKEFVSIQDGGLRKAVFARLDRKHHGKLTQADFARGWGPEMFLALSHGRNELTAGDIQQGFPTTVVRPPQPQQPVEATAQPTRRIAGGACWVPLLADGKHVAMIFPWQPLCP